MKKVKFISLIATSVLSAAAVASIINFNKDSKKLETNIDDATKTLVDYNEDGTVEINDKYIDELTDPIYVSPKGDANAPGTKKKPMSFSVACATAKPGTTILLEAGTYSYDYRLQVGGTSLDPNTVHGDETNYITVRPIDLNKRVIFDFSKQAFDGNNRGIQLYGNFWHFYGIEICGAGDNGMYIAGSHNIIENCKFYNNRDTGLQIGRGSSSEATLNEWPCYNLIKNCTSFANYDDVTFGENADGFAAKLTVGYGNIFDGCMAFRNSDDGWDLFAKVDSGDIGTVILTNCVSFENGYLPYKNFNKEDTAYYNTYNTLNGDGIGFKLGGSTMKGNVIVENCAAWDNKLHGVSDNSNPGVIQIKNFTAFNNCAGLDFQNGKVSDTRGIDGITNKSNNIDVARSVDSYNSYYGVLSYVNNQTKFTTANDSSYNKDAFRGSTAYSIFNTSYDHGENYKSFTAYEDASSYNSDLLDISYSAGTDYSGLSDSDFVSLKPINAIVDSVKDIDDLVKLHNEYRNLDGSINMGDHLALASDKLKTYCEGNPIGAVLNKKSTAEYNHYPMYTFRNNSTDYTDDQVTVLSAYSVTECITNYDAVYQDFRLPKLIHGADIQWASSNDSVISIETSEEVSVSSSVFSWARINVPEKDTKVTLTATISAGAAKTTKTFNLNVKGRNQSLGELASSSTDIIRVELYSSFIEPDVYALDDSSITATRLPDSDYTMSYKYEYALDGNSIFYTIDDVYTSVPGVFRVTATATSTKDSKLKSSYTYLVYVIDYDCPIDFISGKSSIALSDEGFVVSGDLSNISGSVIATYSTTPLTLNSASDILELGNGNYQEVEIETNSIVAPFVADNKTIVSGDTQYYMYYSVVNTNKSNTTNAVYSSTISVKNVNSLDEFYYLARTGILPGGSSNNTTIYSLTKDLDYQDYSWNVKATTASGTKITIEGEEYTVIPEGFKGLFRGNGHTIKNIKIDSNEENVTATDKYVNVFYKLDNGTVMDVKFDNIVLRGDAASKQIGIIGDMVGGYVADIHATRVEATGKESAGGIIAKISGGINNVKRCSLINPIPEDVTTLEKIQSTLQYRITTTNKYEGGIIGNAQLNSDQSILYLNVYNCYVNALIGDGKDSGGNAGLLIGRCKAETVDYVLDIEHNVVYGMVVSKGQYQGGIVGDFDNGLSQTTIKYNVADVKFMYNSVYLDAYDAAASYAEQKYAHKNSSPIVGRAVHADDGNYYTGYNVGSWVEYYNTYIVSSSIAFDYSNYEDDKSFWVMSEAFALNTLGFDPTLWTYQNGTLILTVLK